MARTYNELDAQVRKNSQLLVNIGVAIVAINMALNGKQDRLVYQVEDIKNIPQSICNQLKVGDIVNKVNHSYRVTFKKNDEGMCLTYIDASRVETQSYDLTDGVWVYNSEDLVEFNNIVTVIEPVGTETVAQGLKINGVNYKLGGGGGDVHLYQHDITFSNYNAKISVLSNSSTPFTVETFYEYLNTKGYNVSTNLYPVNGGNAYKGTSSGYINTIDVFIGVYAHTVANKFKLVASSLNIKFDTDKNYDYTNSSYNNSKTMTIEQQLSTPIPFNDNVITIF